jgi:hypothetical protein
MNQRVAAQTVCFLAPSPTLRSRLGPPQRGVCPFLALCVLAMSRGFSTAATSGRPRVGGVGGVLSEDGISLWAMAYSHSTFWGSLGDRETHTGTIFPAPIVEFLAGTRAHTPTSGDLSPRYSAEMLLRIRSGRTWPWRSRECSTRRIRHEARGIIGPSVMPRTVIPAIARARAALAYALGRRESSLTQAAGRAS